MAAGVYRAANRVGLSIPGDLSIVGFDDGALASRLLPSLTTIRLPIRELGRIAALKILHPEAAGSAHAMVTPIEPHLVIRDSCQACQALAHSSGASRHS
jgi:LacI family transcriptional regulator